MSEKDRLLELLIEDFSKEKLVQFYKLSSDKFRPVSEDFSDNLPKDDKRFKSVEQIGRIEHEKKAQSIAFFIFCKRRNFGEGFKEKAIRYW